ncbi:MAG: dihydroorotate dehydrogenase B catalytic subunit, partial [Deltaproteobacteria bacterium RBG_16_50_11]
MPDLSVNIGRLILRNPVMPAAGTFGYGKEYESFLDLNRIGAIIVKTITLKPRIGSFPHRSTETPSGWLGSVGLQNVGIDRFIEEKLPFFDSILTPLIVSLGGETVEEYVELAHRVNREKRIDALEVNVSCPNVKKGGIQFGIDPEVMKELVSAVRQATDKILIIKLSPMVSHIRVFAEISQQHGADAISLINSPIGLAIDIEKRRSKLGRNITGGLAGPAIKPLALYLVWQVFKAVDLPVIGIGGISSAEDAIEFFIAGAS